MSDRQRYALLSESIPVGIVFQGPDGEVVEANATALKILGVANAGSFGSGLTSLLGNAVDERGRELPAAQHPAWIALLTKREVSPRVVGLIGANRAGPLWVRIRSFPFVDTCGEVLHICTTLEEVNDPQVQEPADPVPNLAGGIAHDFNNVLTVVSGHAELLEARLRDDPEALSELREIISATKSASVLTRNLLTLGRKQRDYASGRLTPDLVARIA